MALRHGYRFAPGFAKSARRVLTPSGDVITWRRYRDLVEAPRGFASARAATEARARAAGFSSSAARAAARHALHEKAGLRLRSEADLHALLPREQIARDKSLKTLSLMRQNKKLSLRQAARARNTTPNSVKKYAGAALERDARGRLVAKPRDRIYRHMKLVNPYFRLGSDNRVVIRLDITDSRTASTVGQYMSAVGAYVNDGEVEPLRQFRGKSIRVAKLSYPLVTDLDLLDFMAQTGELRFETIYED